MLTAARSHLIARLSTARGVLAVSGPAQSVPGRAFWCSAPRWQEEAKQAEAAAGQSNGESSGENGTGVSAEAGEEQGETDAEKVTRLEEEVAHATDRAQRALAEMQNIRMIANRDVEQARTYAIQSFAKSLLDVCDNLERAIGSVSSEQLQEGSDVKKLFDGVEMTRTGLMKTFNQHGIVQFGEQGDTFDPHRYEALFEMDVPEQDSGTVAQVISTGFMFKDRVLRPARVGTVRKQ